MGRWSKLAAQEFWPGLRFHRTVDGLMWAVAHEFSDFDATVSGLALNLVQEPMAAPAEMIRVTRHD
jgi:hypothetical protein